MRIKILIGVMLICMLSLLTGCVASKERYISPDEIARQQSVAIMEAVKEQDAEALKEMFCEHVKSTHELDHEIEEFFEFIDGEIISYDTPFGGTKAKSTTTERTEAIKLTGHTYNIKTDNEKTYEIGFNSYQVYVKDENYIGVTDINITDIDMYTEENGFPSESFALIGETVYD